MTDDMIGLVTVEQMMAAENVVMAGGVSNADLIEKAASACVTEIVKRWSGRRVIVLCGPGGNGRDGFVIARMLTDKGFNVQTLLYVSDGGPCESAEQSGWQGAVARLSDEDADKIESMFLGVDEMFLVVDALFGLSMRDELTGAAEKLAKVVNDLKVDVLSVDIPSGLHGDGSASSGRFFKADLTVTFAALKPVHVLVPGAAACGEIIVADIGIGEDTLLQVGALSALNGPEEWGEELPWPGQVSHKHARGHLGVFSGKAGSTGAARLAALAGLRNGAGLVTLFADAKAILELAASNLSIMIREAGDPASLGERARDLSAMVIGPASGVNVDTRQHVLSLLRAGVNLVIDADALTVFSDDPKALTDTLHSGCVLTPHKGEFDRVFPGLLEMVPNRMEAVRQAAERSGCTVLLKGADTVIGAPGGILRVNKHASPWLATAGSGDVLAGMIGALMAQGVDGFTAACAASWMHGDIALRHGPGLIAEDLIEGIPEMLRDLQILLNADAYDRPQQISHQS